MKLGLSLSGGGVKGSAHIGVIKALEEENIKIDSIAGTSSGSIVASLYAMGFSADEMYAIFKKYCKKIKYVDWWNIVDVASRSIGLLSNELANYEWEGTEYLLEIHTEKIGLLDMDKIDELYEIGYKTAKKQIKEIIKKIDR